MKNFVLGDVHGAFRALIQCFKLSGFNYNEDKLIVLGDVVDSWPDVFECVEELLKIKNLVYVLGNHDQWALDWATNGLLDYLWISQGGQATIKSYEDHGGMPESHLKLFRTAPYKYVDNNKLFVHGGIDLNVPFDKQDIDTLLWDRDLIMTARMKGHSRPDYKLTSFDEIYVGHTTTEIRFNTTKPVHFCEVFDIDTGAGWSGKLTIMDIDSKEYYQSDLVTELYPEVTGRN